MILNHFHLTLWPRHEGDLSDYMMWLLTAYVRRYHKHYDSSGHIYQGRFRSFPTQEDDHLLTVLRYIERNPVRAGWVAEAQDWPWSSAAIPRFGSLALDVGLAPRRPAGWNTPIHRRRRRQSPLCESAIGGGDRLPIRRE